MIHYMYNLHNLMEPTPNYSSQARPFSCKWSVHRIKSKRNHYKLMIL